jgi:DNA-binding NarL/FixJ family response regulator
VRIAIADDSALFRSGLVLLLEASGVQVTTQATSGTELIARLFPPGPGRTPPARIDTPIDIPNGRARTPRPDAVILDLRMPPTFTGEGIAAAAEIRARDPGIGILVLSTFAEASYASQLMDALGYGVGYLLKDTVTDAGHLVGQLERIVAGETVLDPTIVRRLLQRKRSISTIDTLNPREREVLARMAEGRSNVGIAQDLYLSPRTVEAHVTSVFGKLGLEQTDTDNNRIRAVLAFLRSAGDRS